MYSRLQFWIVCPPVSELEEYIGAICVWQRTKTSWTRSALGIPGQEGTGCETAPAVFGLGPAPLCIPINAFRFYAALSGGTCGGNTPSANPLASPSIFFSSSYPLNPW
ncbi:hypothetical protein PGT21_033767 [Puccinia graminis f. sp. tritici]|uniref:Uncharacterized protein n=1 Tax=Puccinia graminis f. sp. tritici TaxID=56615 RepID=A0A5B0NUD3_PUCGR|nr:hypothetical protein PGT21_033767 [Puccinia graminis f. sp. tritici]